MARMVYPGEFYRHFKNKLYQIVAVAEHSETGERMVVYQALYGDYRVYVRPYEMFVSEVDHGKYPDVEQTYRFERVEMGATGTLGAMAGVPGASAAPASPARRAPNPAFLRFLEADTYEERMEWLKKLSATADQTDLDNLYVVLDMVPREGTIEEQIRQIARQLAMQNRYDGNRLR